MTTTHTTEQIAYATKMAREMAAKKAGTTVEFWFPMALRLAETTVIDT
jgi:hypothetical protein